MLVLIAVLYISFKPPQVIGVSSFRVLKMNKKEIVIDCTLKLMNSNPYSIFCKKLDVSLLHNNTSWAQANLIAPTSIVSEGETDIPMRCNIKNEISDLSIEEVLNTEELSITNQINGEFTFIHIPYSTSFPIIVHPKNFITQHINELTKSMDFSITDFEIKKFNLDHIVLGSSIQIRNILPFPIFIKEGNICLFSDEQSSDTISVWRQEKELQLEQHQITRIPIEWQLNNFNLGRWGLSQIAKGYLDASLNGFININFKENVIQLPLKQLIRIYPLSQKIEIIK